VEVIVICPYPETIVLELRECSKLPDIGLQFGSESTWFWQFTWTIVNVVP